VQFRIRFQLQPVLSAVLFIAIGLLGWRAGVPAADATGDDRAIVRKAGDVAIHGRDARPMARKAAAAGPPQMEFRLRQAFGVNEFARANLLTEAFEHVAALRFGENFRGRAPPVTV
jgi:hypothetical protein